MYPPLPPVVADTRLNDEFGSNLEAINTLQRDLKLAGTRGGYRHKYLGILYQIEVPSGFGVWGGMSPPEPTRDLGNVVTSHSGVRKRI